MPSKSLALFAAAAVVVGADASKNKSPLRKLKEAATARGLKELLDTASSGSSGAPDKRDLWWHVPHLHIPVPKADTGEFCVVDANCAKEEDYCIGRWTESKCQPKLALGEECHVNESCASGKCVSKTCSDLLSQGDLGPRTFKTGELKDGSYDGPMLKNGLYDGPITLGTASHGLPANMQGVFWLQDQADSSSIVSFAPSRDGHGLSVWNGNSDRQISVRVGGDKVWSFASQGRSWELVEGIDLVYNFEGTRDGQPSSDPTHFNIIPEALNLGIELKGKFLEWALNFQMSLIEKGTAEHGYPATANYPAAVMWGRPSSVGGIDIESSYYEIAQIIDGNGKPTSAFEKWVKYNNNPVSDSEAWKDGTIYYHSA